MSVSWSINRHLSNLQTESAAFFALVLQALVMVFLLWEEGVSMAGFKSGGVAINALGVCKMAA